MVQQFPVEFSEEEDELPLTFLHPNKITKSGSLDGQLFVPKEAPTPSNRIAKTASLTDTSLFSNSNPGFNYGFNSPLSSPTLSPKQVCYYLCSIYASSLIELESKLQRAFLQTPQLRQIHFLPCVQVLAWLLLQLRQVAGAVELLIHLFTWTHHRILQEILEGIFGMK